MKISPCPRCEQGFLQRCRHESFAHDFWLCHDCEGIWFGRKLHLLPDDMLELVLRRNHFEAGLTEVDYESSSPEDDESEVRIAQARLRRSNRMLPASQLARLLVETCYFGLTYTLLPSLFHRAFPEIPVLLLEAASVSWNGIGGTGTDDEFDSALEQCIGPNAK